MVGGTLARWCKMIMNTWIINYIGLSKNVSRDGYMESIDDSGLR